LVAGADILDDESITSFITNIIGGLITSANAAERRQATVRTLRSVVFVFFLIEVLGLTFSIAVSSIAFGCAAIAWIALMVASGSWRDIKGTPLDWFFLAYVAAEVLSATFALDKTTALMNLKRLLLIGNVYIAMSTLSSERRVMTFLGTLIGFTTLLTIFEIVDYFAAHLGRLSIFQHYMTAGGIEMMLLLLTLPFILHTNTPPSVRVAAFLCVLPHFAALLLTFTRSSWLGLLGGAIFIAAFRSKYIVLAIVLCVILFLLLAPLPLRERAYSIVSLSDPSNATRLRMWKTGLRIFADHPLLGIGDTDVRDVYMRYTTPLEPAEGGHLHNNLVQLLVTLGLVGLTSVVALFVKMFLVELKIVRQLRQDWFAGSVALGALAAFIGFQINGIFEWNFGDHEVAVLLWSTVGLALAVDAIRSGQRLSQSASTTVVTEKRGNLH